MTHEDFTLHPQLAADTIAIADLKLSRLLLVNDNNFPWTILVPRRDNIKEAYKLSAEDQLQLLHESNALCTALEELLTPDKLNVAALGNMVPQLHVHHIARFATDAAWPAPVWGAVPARPYDNQSSQHLKEQLITKLSIELRPLA